ncbi:MAG: hypothetical protein R2724_05680 [Bryobacterales bacterium]
MLELVVGVLQQVARFALELLELEPHGLAHDAVAGRADALVVADGVDGRHDGEHTDVGVELVAFLRGDGGGERERGAKRQDESAHLAAGLEDARGRLLGSRTRHGQQATRSACR